MQAGCIEPCYHSLLYTECSNEATLFPYKIPLHIPCAQKLYYFAFFSSEGDLLNGELRMELISSIFVYLGGIEII